MANIFIAGWFFVALFVFICIMGLLIHDKLKHDAEDKVRAMITEAHRKG